MSASLFGLEGKTVLVTGGATGIGAAISRALASIGANVIVHYRSSEVAAAELVEEVAQAGVGQARSLQADLATASAVRSFADQALGIFDGIHVVVNNAGEPLLRRAAVEVTDAEYAAIMDLNMGSVFWLTRDLLPHLREQDGASVITVTSLAARNGGGPGTVVYAAAKAAAATFTRGLAKEMAPYGVRVNAVAPGIIDTDLHRRRTPPEAYEAMVSSIPMGRAGTADECAGAALYLASSRLSGYVTGQAIEVNGGLLMP